jgi:hypothetical protein
VARRPARTLRRAVAAAAPAAERSADGDAVARRAHDSGEALPCTLMRHASVDAPVHQTRAVSSVGVDLNAASQRAALFPPLQFVCGLGPAKAKHLRDAVKAFNGVTERATLITRKVLDRVVFRNAAGFLRIRSSRRRLGASRAASLRPSRAHDTGGAHRPHRVGRGGRRLRGHGRHACAP